MKMIAVTNSKGGVGKTTIAMGLAYLSSGLLVDLDNDQADAYYYSTGNNSPIDCQIVQSNYGYHTVWVDDLQGFPDISYYTYVVLDGRPSGAVNQFISQNADVVVIPWSTESDVRMAKMFQHRLSGTKTMMLRNMIRSSGRGIPYDMRFRKMNPRITADLLQEVWHELQ